MLDGFYILFLNFFSVWIVRNCLNLGPLNILTNLDGPRIKKNIGVREETKGSYMNTAHELKIEKKWNTCLSLTFVGDCTNKVLATPHFLTVKIFSIRSVARVNLFTVCVSCSKSDQTWASTGRQRMEQILHSRIRSMTSDFTCDGIVAIASLALLLIYVEFCSNYFA